eukprot:1196980-Amorphochlora_amoeboformis.AAC.1
MNRPTPPFSSAPIRPAPCELSSAKLVSLDSGSLCKGSPNDHHVAGVGVCRSNFVGCDMAHDHVVTKRDRPVTRSRPMITLSPNVTGL